MKTEVDIDKLTGDDRAFWELVLKSCCVAPKKIVYTSVVIDSRFDDSVDF